MPAKPGPRSARKPCEQSCSTLFHRQWPLGGLSSDQGPAAEDERNRAAKLVRSAHLALPPHERLAVTAASVDAKWAMPKAQVDAEEVKATMTRVKVVEVVREIIVECPLECPPPVVSYSGAT